MTSLAIKRRIVSLGSMTPKQLRAEYETVFGEPSRSGNRAHLIKRIAWRIQADAEGTLSERACQRAAELGRESDLRVRPPDGTSIPAPRPGVRDPRLPPTGSVLTREYKGTTVEVAVRDGDFEYAGDVYPTLSAVARAVTGSHINGFRFFRLGRAES